MKPIRSLCLLLAVLALTACGGGTPPAETTAAPAQTTLPVTTAAPAPDYSAIAQSGELWLEAGLACYTGEIALTLDMADFLGTGAAWTYLSLSDDLFFVDSDTARQVAGHFFTFVMEQYGYDALFDLSRRESLKDAFVKAYYPEKTYAFAGEAVLAGMDCRSESGKYIITLEGAEYIADAATYMTTANRTLILYNALARRALLPMLAELDPQGEYFDTTRTLTYTLALGSGASLTRQGTGQMTVSTYDAMLHQTLHALGLTDRQDDHHWLTEGLCEYFGKALGYDQWVTTNYHAWLAMAEAGQLNPTIAESAFVTRYRREYEAYAAMGGSAASAAEFSMPLLLHAKARCDREDGAVSFQTVCSLGADTLSEAEAASLTMYLIERHGMDTVLAVWADYSSFAAAFGGSYDEVVAAWQTWLAAK